MTDPVKHSTRVLLVESETDSLSTLGVALLERGFEVSVIDDPGVAFDSPDAPKFDVFLVDEETLRSLGPKLDALLRQRHEPHLVLVGDAETAWDMNEVSRRDVDVIIERIGDLLRGGSLPEAEGSAGPARASPTSRAGSLAEGWLVGVVEAFAAERVTGMLSVTTTYGAGELRFARGELVDAVYATLDGLKAIYRVARMKEGTWSFTEASSLVMRRITMATAELLRLLPAEVKRAAELEGALGDLSGWALMADPPQDQPLGTLAATLVERLRRPRALEAVLDESPETDAELLAALVELDAAVLLRRVRTSARAVAFESPAQVDRAVAQAAQASASGFRGPVRVVFAGSPTSLALLAHAASRLEEVVTPAVLSPDAAVPHEIAKLRLVEDAAVALVALPLDPVYSPLWPLAVAGASAVVCLSAAGDSRLAEVCSASSVPLFDGLSVVPDLDASSPAQVARLLRVALGAEV
jgi:hypothetical protein